MRHILISNRSAKLRQVLACLLLLYFSCDFVVDSFPPLPGGEGAGSSAAFSVWSGSGSNSGDDHPGWGFGDHGCALTHYHHFPIVLGRTCFAPALAIVVLPISDALAFTEHAPLVDHPIRAPPAA